MEDTFAIFARRASSCHRLTAMNGIIHVIRYVSPCGRMVIGNIDGALCLCDWDRPERRSAVDIRMSRDFHAVFEEGCTELTSRAVKQLDEYFSGIRREFDIPLAVRGSEFRRSVWRALSAIGYGATISYGELARRVGRPDAVRAVAAAVGANPLSIFIPCHRVIASDGSIGGYAGSVHAKRMLLDIEAGRHLTAFANASDFL